MVIPWRGFPLRDLIGRVEPTLAGEVRGVHDAARPGADAGAAARASSTGRTSRGCGMDEAMHPLTLMATGLYGRDLPNQNGAPLRLVVPWKYGFKSIKSIVRISLRRATAADDAGTRSAPDEYGFYANVNPRGGPPALEPGAASGASARCRRRPTLMFNGYGEQVARLYCGHGPPEGLLTGASAAARRRDAPQDRQPRRQPDPSRSPRRRLPRRRRSRSSCSWWTSRPAGSAVEPVEAITHRTGWWALTLLLVTLAVTPIRRLTGWNPLIKLRRPLGLFAFFYATLHVLTYFGLDQFFDLSYIAEDILERPYITVGFTAWVLLVPLAVTSTRGWIRRLGGRWQALHRLVYVSAGLAVLHFLWLVKADTREPLIFAAVLVFLLLFRLPIRRWSSAVTWKRSVNPGA